MDSEISIVVPIYNEKKIIENFINKLFNTFNKIDVKYIFVDDGSKDGTSVWLKKNLNVLQKKSGPLKMKQILTQDQEVQ